jgi:hypothetical protein
VKGGQITVEGLRKFRDKILGKLAKLEQKDMRLQSEIARLKKRDGIKDK